MLMLDAAAIAARIPHAGPMSLLDGVLDWTETHIVCQATSHRRLDNPMVQDGRLDAICGIEYAGQAMALHGALTAETATPRKGYLANVRSVVCAVPRLDDLPEPLRIEAHRLMGEAGRVIYRFAITCNDMPIVSGQAAVVIA